MSESALLMMLATWAVVGGFTLYFFVKVLLSKPNSEKDRD